MNFPNDTFCAGQVYEIFLFLFELGYRWSLRIQLKVNSSTFDKLSKFESLKEKVDSSQNDVFNVSPSWLLELPIKYIRWSLHEQRRVNPLTPNNHIQNCPN